MNDVYRACALLSQSSLALESMKRFNNGVINADHVEEQENCPKDRVGTALLRFSLQGLKGVLFFCLFFFLPCSHPLALQLAIFGHVAPRVLSSLQLEIICLPR
jgi:hypothetical protein